MDLKGLSENVIKNCEKMEMKGVGYQ